MGKTLYILKEEINQEPYKTKVRFLYTSEVNQHLVYYVETQRGDFRYLSNTFGLLHPNEDLDPYKVQLLNYQNRKTWSLLTAELINRECLELGFKTLTFLLSDKYDELESRLEWFGYEILKPIHHLKTSKMKIKWVYNELHKDLCKFLEKGK
jgi:hypothetical protein